MSTFAKQGPRKSNIVESLGFVKRVSYLAQIELQSFPIFQALTRDAHKHISGICSRQSPTAAIAEVEIRPQASVTSNFNTGHCRLQRTAGSSRVNPRRARVGLPCSPVKCSLIVLATACTSR